MEEQQQPEERQQSRAGKSYGIVSLLIAVMAIGAAGWGAWCASGLVKQLSAPSPASATPLKRSRPAPVVITPADVTAHPREDPSVGPDGVITIDPSKPADSSTGPQGRLDTPDPGGDTLIERDANVAIFTPAETMAASMDFASAFAAPIYPKGLQAQRQPRIYAASDPSAGSAVHAADPMAGEPHFYQYDDQGNAGIQRVNQGFSWQQH